MSIYEAWYNGRLDADCHFAVVYGQVLGQFQFPKARCLIGMGVLLQGRS